MAPKSMTPSFSSRSIVLSSMLIWSSGVMSAVMAPFDASGSVLRQNGSSSWIDTGVGLFSPITLNGSSAVLRDGPERAQSAPFPPTINSACQPPLCPRHRVKSAKCMPWNFVLNSRRADQRSPERNAHAEPDPRPSQQDRRSGPRQGARDEHQAPRRRRARPVGSCEVAAARGRRQHVPLRRRRWQGMGLGRHGRGEPHPARRAPRRTRSSSGRSAPRRRASSCRRPAPS